MRDVKFLGSNLFSESLKQLKFKKSMFIFKLIKLNYIIKCVKILFKIFYFKPQGATWRMLSPHCCSIPNEIFDIMFNCIFDIKYSNKHFKIIKMKHIKEKWIYKLSENDIQEIEFKNIIVQSNFFFTKDIDWILSVYIQKKF